MAAIPIYILYWFFAALPVRPASSLAGWLGRNLGPKLPMSRIAHLNLQYVWPHLDFVARQKIITGMWDNYFRLFAEYPHLKDIMNGKGGKLVVHGAQYLTDMAQTGRACIALSAHFGNWEFAPMLSAKLGFPVSIVWRPPNNPYVARLLERGRATENAQFRKGAKGARQMIAHLKSGQSLCMLMDQKMNDGMAVPFMGKPAMTAAAAADLALKYNCPIIMVRCQRVRGTEFEITVSEPVEFTATNDRQSDARRLLEWVNAELAQWITEVPDQWLWLHQRWKKWPKKVTALDEVIQLLHPE